MSDDSKQRTGEVGGGNSSEQPAVDSLAAFEELVADPARVTYRFRLFISGSSPRSAAAVANVSRICEEYLADRYELEVIDVYQQPHAIQAAQVIVVPTLIKEFPLPVQRYVGDMSNIEKLVAGLRLRG